MKAGPPWRGPVIALLDRVDPCGNPKSGLASSLILRLGKRMVGDGKNDNNRRLITYQVINQMLNQTLDAKLSYPRDVCHALALGPPIQCSGKRVRCPQTQKFCCWLTPTRDSHTGQPDREVQWSSLTMEVPPS
ncbi:hypothetical protein DINM_001378 [Dirofilaria immitis]|nr:hypothetical protein [Dirofilaria immitis]